MCVTKRSLSFRPLCTECGHRHRKNRMGNVSLFSRWCVLDEFLMLRCLSEDGAVASADTLWNVTESARTATGEHCNPEPLVDGPDKCQRCSLTQLHWHDGVAQSSRVKTKVSLQVELHQVQPYSTQYPITRRKYAIAAVVKWERNVPASSSTYSCILSL